MVFSIAFFVSLLHTVNCKAVGVSAHISVLPTEFSCSCLPSTLLGYEGVSHYDLRYDGSIGQKSSVRGSV